VQSQLLRRWRHEDGGFKASPGKGSETLSQKQNFNKRAGGVTQVVALVWHAVRPWVQSPIPPKKKAVSVLKILQADWLHDCGEMGCCNLRAKIILGYL
jgi:hypothetical protein